MAASLKGPWSAAQIDEYLHSSIIPVRLACTAADGFPRVVSVWFRYRRGCLYSVSHRDSKLVALLRDSNKVGFEVSPNEPPYCGVRGQAIATLLEVGAGEELEQLLQRYLGGTGSSLGNWLLSRVDEEILIRIEPQRVFSWDYRQRMSDA